MKKKQTARNRARVASAKELERDAKEQLAYLDHYKPRPRKMTAEEESEAQAQLAYLDERDALANHFWRELVAHLRRGNLTAAHYLLTSPAYLGSFIVGSGPQPPAEVKQALGKLGIKSRGDLQAHLEDRLGAHRGTVLLQVLQMLGGACLYGEMLALLPYAREAMTQTKDLRLEQSIKGKKTAGASANNARQAVAICRQAMLHLSPDRGAQSEDADLITMRQRAAGLSKPKARRKR